MSIKKIKELPPKFKEIKSEEEESDLEEELEEEFESQPEQDFTEFITEGERAAPVLETTDLTQDEVIEDLETDLQTIPDTTDTDQVSYEQSTSNVPQYGGDYEQMVDYDDVQEQRGHFDDEVDLTHSRFTMRPEQMRQEERHLNLGTFQQRMTDQPEHEIRGDYQINVKRTKDKKKLPFEQ